ncbi:MAG: hypothetical protein LUC94_01235 [Clostridiales bacterium]|nr:hypothetical protein [Clostridiales bacterium]
MRVLDDLLKLVNVANGLVALAKSVSGCKWSAKSSKKDPSASLAASDGSDGNSTN